jgi:WD40 repeat protein
MHRHLISYQMKIGYFIIALLYLCYGTSEAQNAQLVLPIGHTDRIHQVSFSPDGKFVLTASRDKTTKLWESKSGKLIHSFTAGSIHHARAFFTPDSKKIVSTSIDYQKTKMWDAESFELQATLDGDLKSVSPMGKYIMTGSSG